MAPTKTIAVVGATGAQGGGLVRAILADTSGEFAARAVVRDPSSDKARALADLGAEIVEPIQGPVLDAPLAATTVEAPRLARHRIELSDGHKVGVAVAGRGIPLVVVHGFSAEGFLYAQTLNRLVKRGFKVIAIDMASHGSTQGLPLGGGSLKAYGELLGRAVEQLGIRKAIFAGLFHNLLARLEVLQCLV